ncbi:MAG: hypothetical protein ACT4OS_10465 [Acidimicrobiales bacterium]
MNDPVAVVTGAVFTLLGLGSLARMGGLSLRPGLLGPLVLIGAGLLVLFSSRPSRD